MNYPYSEEDADENEDYPYSEADADADEIPPLLTLPVNQILTSQRSFAQASYDNANGRGSRTQGPLKVWLLEDGRYLLVDGQHRFAEGVKQGRKEFSCVMVGEGYSDYWATPEPGMEYRIRRNPDEDFRSLQRQAEEGDPVALDALVRQARRVGDLTLVPSKLLRNWKLKDNVRELAAGRLPLPDYESKQLERSSGPSFYPGHRMIFVFPNGFQVLVIRSSLHTFNVMLARNKVSKRTYQKRVFLKPNDFIGTFQSGSEMITFNLPAVPVDDGNFDLNFFEERFQISEIEKLIEKLKTASQFRYDGRGIYHHKKLMWRAPYMLRFVD